MHYDLLIRGGVCVLPWGEEEADVGVIDGRIAAIGAFAAIRPRRCSTRPACMCSPA